MLPALLFSLAFLLPAWWLWRSGRRPWAVVPLVITLLLVGLTCAIQLANVNRTQAVHDTEILLDNLAKEDLFAFTQLTDRDETLFMASAGSQALYAAYQGGAVAGGRIDSVLSILAARVTDRTLFPRWNRSRNWDYEVFFLAHAGAVLAHYQLVTGDGDTYGRDLAAIGKHLAGRMHRGRYKHLISRGGEDFFRPADNAAALYTLSLYDRLTGEGNLAKSFTDWTDYLRDELYYAESRLPCAAFSSDNVCYREPSAVATGLYIAYRAAAAPERVDTDIPWREWLHYFRRSNLSPFTVSIRPNMRDGQAVRFCSEGARPLGCDRFERAVGLWAAAEYDGSYTYFRLFSTVVFRRWFGTPVSYRALPASKRTPELTGLALRTVGAWRSGR